MAIARYDVGAVRLTRVPYFDVELPPDALGITAAAVARVPWARPVWCQSADAVRVGQAFWLIESAGRLVVVDPCGAADAFLRTGPAALTHQQAAFAELRAAGFEPDAVEVVVMSHLDGIGMNALVDDTGAWSPAFPNAALIVSEAEALRIATHDTVSGAGAFRALEHAGVVRHVTPPHDVTDDVRLVLSGGHTAGHVTVVVESDGARALLLGHLAINPVHATVGADVPLHDDPALGSAALARWLADAATDGRRARDRPALAAPWRGAVRSLDPLVLEPVSG